MPKFTSPDAAARIRNAIEAYTEATEAADGYEARADAMLDERIRDADNHPGAGDVAACAFLAVSNRVAALGALVVELLPGFEEEEGDDS